MIRLFGRRDDGLRLAHNAENPLRLGPYGEQIVNDIGFGKFYEACRTGRLFHLLNSAQTIAATHNSPLAAATGTPIVGILNPNNSGKAAIIQSGWMTTISGTPPAQANPTWNFAQNQLNISTNPAGTILSGKLDPIAGTAMKAYNNVALTGLNTASGNIGAIRHFGGAPFAGAIAANHDQGWFDAVEGALIVPPGCICGIFAGAAAGTTWIVSAMMSWVEADWPL